MIGSTLDQLDVRAEPVDERGHLGEGALTLAARVVQLSLDSVQVEVRVW